MTRSVFQMVSLVLLPGLVGAALTAGAAGAKNTGTDLDADPHLAARWTFDETSGTTAADATKHGRDGTLKGGLTFEKHSAAGRCEKALTFQGKGVVEVKGYKGVTGTRPRTVAAWIQTKDSKGEVLAWGGDEFGKRWSLKFIRGRLGISPQGGYLYMNDPVHDGKWHHVAAVVREAERPNLHDDVTLYKDGEKAAIHDIGLLDLWPIDTAEGMDVHIGGGFKGLIDDVRIYDRALSAEEIKALFTRSK